MLSKLKSKVKPGSSPGDTSVGSPVLALGIALALGLSGCSTMFGGGSTATPAGSSAGSAASTSADGPVLADASGLAGYLNMMRQLSEADPLTRAEIFNDARDGAEFAPTRENRLRYALALSVPGHSGSDPALAAQRLREFVAAGDALPPEERVIAEIQLQFSEQLQLLVQNNADLRVAAATAEAQAETSGSQRAQNAAEIAALQAENRQLTEQLEEANSMLDAITSIEESISEREIP